MKRVLCAVCALLAAGCSSSSSPAAAPTPAVQTTTTAPAGPVFPQLVGVWTGTVAITMAVNIVSESVTETCNSTWTNLGVSSSGAFSGSETNSGSTGTNASNCSGGVNYTGTVTTAGAVSIPNFNNWPLSGVSWRSTPLNDATCGLKAVTAPMAGTVFGRSWTMTQKDSWLCINSTVQVDRTFLVQLTQ